MKKFTLIELLVVIAVIGILVSILMPSLVRAREKTKRAVCLSNLSQTYKALVIYNRNDNNKFPPAQPVVNGNGIFAVKNGSVWFGHGFLVKEGYVKTGRLFYCPSSTHKSHKYGKGGSYGGFQPSGNPLPRTVTTGYQYRSTFGSPFRAASIYEDEPGDALMSDHMSSNYSVNYTHKDGHNILYLDGGVMWNGDKTLLYLGVTNMQHGIRETGFWQKVDRN